MVFLASIETYSKAEDGAIKSWLAKRENEATEPDGEILLAVRAWAVKGKVVAYAASLRDALRRMDALAPRQMG